MASRLSLHETLCALLESRNVYFNPPESIKMKYPAIVYTRRKPDVKKADDTLYKYMDSYEITLIDEDPDIIFLVALKLLQLPYCSEDRFFKSDNLHHNTFTLYY